MEKEKEIEVFLDKTYKIGERKMKIARCEKIRIKEGRIVGP